MLPPSSILLLALLQGAPIMQPHSTTACKDLRRIELALSPTAALFEICVSPGLMTNFVFDVRTEVDLQDEVRFQEVTRGRNTLSLLPPPDLTSGERLRLTALLGEGATQQRVSFSLVAHPGQATHQVEVYRDQRPRESLLHEIAQEQAENQKLRNALKQSRAQLEQLQIKLAQPRGLRDLIANGTINASGVMVNEFNEDVTGRSESALTYKWGSGYRATKSIAAEVWLTNLGSEPWMVAVGSLVDAHGRELRGVKLRQDSPIEPNSEGLVIVEVDALRSESHGELTLSLRDEGARGITIPGLTFP